MRPIDGDKLQRVLENFERHLIEARSFKAARAIRAVIKFLKSPTFNIKEDTK